MRKFLNSLIQITCFFVLITSCSTQRPEGKTEAEVLYKEAQSYIDDSLYNLAIQRLNKLRSKHPYSYYATHAELLQADILFKQEKYAEAAAAYEVFRDFHPKHERIHYVLYKLAESYYMQLPSTYDRDLTSARKAINYYQELIREYPGSEHVEEAKKKIAEAQEMLRKKQKYIADFYFKTEVYDSARFRYLDILENFSHKELREHSMTRVVRSSAKMKKFKECRNYYKEYKQQVSAEAKEKLEKAVQPCLEN